MDGWQEGRETDDFFCFVQDTTLGICFLITGEGICLEEAFCFERDLLVLGGNFKVFIIIELSCRCDDFLKPT